MRLAQSQVLFVDLGFDFHEAVPAFYTLAGSNMNDAHNAADGRGEGGFHLHSFGDNQGGALGYGLALFNQHFDYGAGEGGGDFAHIGLVGLLARNLGGLGIAVLDFDFTG